MEHRLDHELDRKDEREEEPEACAACLGHGEIPKYHPPSRCDRLCKCPFCNGTGQEESDDESIPY